MLNVFIINPVAGGGRAVKTLKKDIESFFAYKKLPYKIEYTQKAGDAAKIANYWAKTQNRVRIFACGGDGTLHEVVNGVVGFDNVEIGVFPCGTGNDYCATYADRAEFMNVENQVNGEAIPVDLIQCDSIYSINQCSIGFDAQVVSKMNLVRNKPIIGGKMSYYTGIVLALVGKIANPLTVVIDDKEVIQGNFLFTVAAKGKYHGGGLKSAPMAEPSSGKLNFMLVRRVSRWRFIDLLPKYIKGKHLKYTDIVINTFGEKMQVKAKRPLPITLDGELIYSEEFNAQIVKSAVKFVVPKVAVNKNKENLKQKITV